MRLKFDRRGDFCGKDIPGDTVVCLDNGSEITLARL